MDIVKDKMEELDEDIGEIPFMDEIHQKTGLKPVHVFGIFIGILFLFVFSGYASVFFAGLVGLVYPIWKSFRALETESLDDDKQWLTYWTVYGIFVIFDDYSEFILQHFPYYYPFKLVFLVWLFSPTTKGAIVMYNSIVKPLFVRYSAKIDEFIDRLVGESQDIVDKAKKDISDPSTQAKLIGAAANVASKLPTDKGE